MVDSLIKCPVRYFDENPTGRILNRFTSDSGLMDLTMHKILSDSLEGSLYILNLLFFIIITIFWIIIPSFIIIIFMAKWT